MSPWRRWRASRPAVSGLKLAAALGVALAGTALAAAPRGAPVLPLQVPVMATADLATPAGCALRLREHRSGRLLLSTALDAIDPQLTVHFTHSVLGTPVADVYRWRASQWWLIEEHFEGQGYGLPHAAADGERLLADGQGSVLHLNRSVAPLVVRPLPALHMRVLLPDGRSWLLGELSRQAVEIDTQGC